MKAQLMIGDVPILGYNLNVTAAVLMPKADLSGQGSATDKADLGIKPKKVTVMLTIPFSENTWLSNIVTLAEKRDDAGAAEPHVIVDNLCSALKIRQVTFCDQVDIFEVDGQRAWDVTFTLSEYKSPAEVADSRSTKRGDSGLGVSFEEITNILDEGIA